ncbi:hypothetical protein [Bradyrhizobium archetypum]|uniref:Uncharacterized protein n=1 Tax=Bradyrhizobium archetypum TaxID=2721160 RepID=A0A7Y4H589_9BRAD|nr:hypothetical protein [Bradyrhizobium archetypum]NOJ47901.1 hypothetical protein [Bradyrhizobium archetypum]
MKSAPETGPRPKSLIAVIVVGLVGVSLLVLLSFSGLPGLKDTRTGTVHGQNIVGKTGSD